MSWVISLFILFSSPSFGQGISLGTQEFNRQPDSVPQKENIFPKTELVASKTKDKKTRTIHTITDSNVVPCPEESHDIETIRSEKIRNKYNEVKSNDCADVDNVIRYLIEPKEMDSKTNGCAVKVFLTCGPEPKI